MHELVMSDNGKMSDNAEGQAKKAQLNTGPATTALPRACQYPPRTSELHGDPVLLQRVVFMQDASLLFGRLLRFLAVSSFFFPPN